MVAGSWWFRMLECRHVVPWQAGGKEAVETENSWLDGYFRSGVDGTWTRGLRPPRPGASGSAPDPGLVTMRTNPEHPSSESANGSERSGSRLEGVVRQADGGNFLIFLDGGNLFRPGKTPRWIAPHQKLEWRIPAGRPEAFQVGGQGISEDAAERPPLLGRDLPGALQKACFKIDGGSHEQVSFTWCRKRVVGRTFMPPAGSRSLRVWDPSRASCRSTRRGRP